MKAWLSPDGDSADLLSDLPAKAAALRSAHAQGARFLAFPVRDNREAAEWALACFHSPLIFVPLPADLPAPALDRCLRQLPPGVIFPESLKRENSAVLPEQRSPGEIWAVIFSSGTTGEPKGVALSGTALEASARSHAAHSGVGSATWLLDLPLYHVGGLSVVTRALFLGASIALGPSRFSAADTAVWLRSGRVQGLSLVPTTLHRLLEVTPDFSPLSLILLGGAPASPALLERARGAGAPAHATYGMTEHSSQIATEVVMGEGLVGLPGVELKIVAGEILVRSPALASGYFRAGSLEPLPLRNGFFPTGDLGEIQNGRLLVQGRASDVIVSGGKKIYPAEVEAELGKIQAIADCAVLGLPDPEWGEMVCAGVVEKNPGGFKPAEAKARLATAIEAYKIPKRWALLPAIPRTPSGKVLRAEFRAAVEASLRTSRN